MLKRHEGGSKPLFRHGSPESSHMEVELDNGTVSKSAQKKPESVGVEPTSRKRRVPPPELRGSVKIDGDIVSSLYSEEEWEAMFERAARQIEGDPEAFK